MKNNLLITGAAGSIGYEIIKKFYKSKYNIIAVDITKKKDLLKSFKVFISAIKIIFLFIKLFFFIFSVERV